MGLDYSYLLYFERKNLWDVLQGVAAVAQPSQLPTLVVFPNHILPLSLKSWGTKERMVKYNEPEFGFATSLYFPEDNEIIEYVKRLFPEHHDALTQESRLGIPIGYIYLTVYNDLERLEHAAYDPNLVMLEFGTTGTTMSMLFLNSRSIRKRFIGFLKEFQGVCGVFDMETSGQAFWLNGSEIDEEISDPYMSPKQIEESLMGRHEETR